MCQLGGGECDVHIHARGRRPGRPQTCSRSTSRRLTPHPIGPQAPHRPQEPSNSRCPAKKPLLHAGVHGPVPQAAREDIRMSTPLVGEGRSSTGSWTRSATLWTTTQPGRGPVAAGRCGSLDQADHEPGKRAASTSRTASARTFWAAETPEPQYAATPAEAVRPRKAPRSWPSGNRVPLSENSPAAGTLSAPGTWPARGSSGSTSPRGSAAGRGRRAARPARPARRPRPRSALAGGQASASGR